MATPVFASVLLGVAGLLTRSAAAASAAAGVALNVVAGAGDGAGAGGALAITSGNTTSGTSGALTVSSGTASAGNSGAVRVRSGTAVGGGKVSGDVSLEVGAATGGATAGRVKLVNLSVADPVVADAIWADHGALVMSGTTLATALTTLNLSGMPVADPGGGKLWLKAGDLHVGP